MSYIISIDLQYNLAVDGSNPVKTNHDKEEDIRNFQYKIEFQGNCDEKRGLKSSSDQGYNRIQELEQQLKLQSIEHKKEIQRKASKIEELEHSISTEKEVSKLQNKCKNLYQGEDEIVLQRIGDISDRAARRRLENRQRYQLKLKYRKI